MRFAGLILLIVLWVGFADAGHVASPLLLPPFGDVLKQGGKLAASGRLQADIVATLLRRGWGNGFTTVILHLR